jgi:hypothetical protein
VLANDCTIVLVIGLRLNGGQRAVEIAAALCGIPLSRGRWVADLDHPIPLG